MIVKFFAARNHCAQCDVVKETDVYDPDVDEIETYYREDSMAEFNKYQIGGSVPQALLVDADGEVQDHAQAGHAGEIIEMMKQVRGVEL